MMRKRTAHQSLRQDRDETGFTIPEVLIALLLFALIASACVYALRLGVDSRDQLGRVDQELRALQLSRILIKEDLAQFVSRPVRGEFGEASPIAFAGGQLSAQLRRNDDGDFLMEFVRGGVLNPDAVAPRSALQHVEYFFLDGAMIRRTRSFLDRTTNSAYQDRVMFDNLTAVEIEFLVGERRGELEWADAWPVSGGAIRPPRAVALTLFADNTQPLRQLFWIGNIAEVQGQ